MNFRDLFVASHFHIVRLARNNNGALNSREGFQGGQKSSAEKQGFFIFFVCCIYDLQVNASENATCPGHLRKITRGMNKVPLSDG